MSLLYTASFKEFGSLVCLWHDVKLRKTQLEVRSLNVIWRRDLWCHRVIVFWKCVKLLAEQLWQIWRRYAPPFFCYLRKTWGGGGADNRPPAVRGFTLAVTAQGGWCNPLGFSENNSRSDRPIITKFGIPTHHLNNFASSLKISRPYLLWPSTWVTWFPRSCQAKFVFRTVSTPEIWELRYFCWWYGHG